MAWNVVGSYNGSQIYDMGNGSYVLSNGQGDDQYWSQADYNNAMVAKQQQQAAQAQSGFQQTGVNPYTGAITQGLRGDLGGENATWGINPKTGQEEAALRGPGGMYLLSDLMQKYGSWDAIKNLQSGQLNEQGNDEGMFQTALWGSRPSNDTFSGKDGLADLIKIAAMAAPVVGGALGGAAATMPAAAGTAEYGGGLAAASAGAGASAAPLSFTEGMLSGAGAPATGAAVGNGAAFAGLGAGSALAAGSQQAGLTQLAQNGTTMTDVPQGLEGVVSGPETGLGQANALEGGAMDMSGSLSSPANAGAGTVMGSSATGLDMGLGGAGALSGGAMDMAGSAANPGAVANGGTSSSIIQGAGTSGADGLQGLMNQLGLGNVGAGGLGGGSGVGGLTGGAGQQGAYQFPYAQALSGLLGYMGSQQQQNSLQQTMQQAINSDQWRSQQGRYNEPLYQAATQGIGNTAYGQSIADATARKSASMGYNMSGNQMHDVAQGLNKGSIDYINAIRPMAMGNGGLGSTIAQLGIAGANAQQQGMGALGQTFGNIMQGNQPTLAQQFQGQGTNNSLIDVFKSVSL